MNIYSHRFYKITMMASYSGFSPAPFQSPNFTPFEMDSKLSFTPVQSTSFTPVQSSAFTPIEVSSGIQKTSTESKPIIAGLTIDLLKAEPNANGQIGQYKDHTDPKYTGPGTWNVIHRLAMQAQTTEKQQTFIQEMTLICHGFPCSVCQNHCRQYLISHPMEEYVNVIIQIDGQPKNLGLFIWSWRFHNAVNTRLKKPLMSWETAYNLFSEKAALLCSDSCLNAEAHL